VFGFLSAAPGRTVDRQGVLSGLLPDRLTQVSASLGANSKDYRGIMSRHNLSIRLPAVVALSLVGLICATSAFAAGGKFRYSHDEPLNDLRVTPGARFNVTVATICRPGYATSVRDVPESEKRNVYSEYGITQHCWST